MIEAVIDFSKEPISKIYDMPVMEFLTYTVYIRMRNKERAKQIEHNKQQRQLMYR